MQKKPDDMGYWMGWFIAFGITAAFFIYVVWSGQSLQDGLCGTREKNCFREWLSSLGGWAAVLVAIPSLIFLSKQIRDTDRHHRRSTALNLRRLRSLASNVAVTSKHASGIAAHWMVIFGNAKGGNIPLLNKRQELSEILDEGMSLLSDRNFEVFEAEIYLPLDHSTFLKSQLSKIRSAIVGAPEILDRLQALEVSKELHEFNVLLKKYMDDVSTNADRFLLDTSEYASLRG